MHGHHRIDETMTGPGFGPEFGPGGPGRGGRPGRDDRFGGPQRGRGRGKGRGRPDGVGRHGFGPGFGPPGFGRGAKRGRGDVKAAILALLAEEPMHGYQIITELTDRSGGVWRPSPGSVYPTLQALEDQGLVVADKAEGKRVFSLTDTGRAEAEAAADGPAPWESARGGNRSLVDLRGLMGEVAGATMQVGRTGSEGQIRTVGDILTDTRRRIYMVLADGAGATDGGAPGPDTAADADADADTAADGGR
jgi:DNA-binding PadR family transcriptional regulator